MTLIRRPIIVLAPVAVLLVLLAMSTNVLPVRHIVEQREQIEATQARLDRLLAENAALTSRVEALDSPVEIERLARGELGYIFPGETAYIVMRPESKVSNELPVANRPGDQTEPGGEPRTGESTPDRSTIARLLDFLTGRDLVDG